MNSLVSAESDQSHPLESNVADAIAVRFLKLFRSIQRDRYIGCQTFQQVPPSQSGRVGAAAYAASSQSSRFVRHGVLERLSLRAIGIG